MASIITSHSVEDMKLKKADLIFVMIKATGPSIQKFRGQGH